MKCPTSSRPLTGFQLIFLMMAILVYLRRFATGFYVYEDSLGYLAYLPNLIFKGDLDFASWFKFVGALPLWVTNTGLIANPWGCGPALLWLPFFLLGCVSMAFSKIPVFADHDLHRLFFFLNVATMVYVALALTLTKSILNRVFGRRNHNRLIVAAFFGTPLFYYATYGGSMSHGTSAFSLCLFAYLCLCRPSSGTKTVYWFAVGSAAGLMVVIRTEMVGYLSLLLVPVSAECNDGLIIQACAQRMSAFLLGCFLMAAPQMLIWKVVFGNWLALPQAYNIQGHFFVLGEILFSPLKGLLYWTPLIFLALLGYAFAPWTPSRKFIGLCGIGLTLQLLLLSTTEGWYSGYSFGPRILTNSFLPIVIGLACPLWVIRNRTWRLFVGSLYLLSTFWTIGLFANHDAGRLNLAAFHTAREILNLQRDVFCHPLRALAELVSPGQLFGLELLVMWVVLALLLAGIWWNYDRLRRFKIEIAVASLAMLAGVFLALSIRAAIRTPVQSYKPASTLGFPPFRIWADYRAIQSRLFEINYFVRDGKRARAQQFLDDTLYRFPPTEAWRYWSQLGGKFFQRSQRMTLDEIGSARPGDNDV